ncbi:MAG: hypothetical protein WDN28_25350 [Chthoniobacter sp.]
MTATIPGGVNASGVATGLHASGSTVWSNPVGNGSAKALSSNTWATGDYYQFTLSINDNAFAGMGLEIAFDQTGSNTGPKDFQLSYSVDGTNFTDFSAVYNVTNDTWTGSSPKPISTRSFDLSSVDAIDTALDSASSTITFRLSMADSNPISGSLGTAGTDRVDNFIVSSVPEPSALFRSCSAQESSPGGGGGKTRGSLWGNGEVSG